MVYLSLIHIFAPNTGYTARQEYNREGTEFKNLIRELHQNGIEVILDVVFNHTAEGNEQGPFFEFKGIDNRIYYMLTPEGDYYNFSGCGNTLNCNHPVVQQMILECLRHWVIHYRVDGFRFDLEMCIRDRNGDGAYRHGRVFWESESLCGLYESAFGLCSGGSAGKDNPHVGQPVEDRTGLFGAFQKNSAAGMGYGPVSYTHLTSESPAWRRKARVQR